MAKTALVELIARMQVNLDLYELTGNAPMAKAYSDIQREATTLLAQERKQIEDAYSDGWQSYKIFSFGIQSEFESASDYYTKTYNDEK